MQVAGVGLFASIGNVAANTAAKIGKTVALVAGAAAVGVVAAFQSFEQAFAGVARTVEATQEELAAIRQGLLDLSETIPIAANELAEIGLVAGQLGIAARDVVAFTEVAAKLGVVTELSSTEAAEGLARVSQITQLAAEDFDNLASVLVDLGNKFVSTEGDILKLSIRIAGASNVIGVAAQEVLGIANAFASIVGPSGLEAAGTAIQKVMLAMLKATREGGKKLAVFAKTAGLTAEQFKKLFSEDPTEAFTLFVEGLGKQGKAAIDTLTELELKDSRLIRTFLQVAGAGDILRRSITEANREFIENIALGKEFAKFADTIQSQFKILTNQFFSAAVALGELIRPGLVAAMKEIGASIDGMVDALRGGIVAFGRVLPKLADLLGEGLTGVLRGAGTALEFFARVLETFGPTIIQLGRIIGIFGHTVFEAFSTAVFASQDAIVSMIESFGTLARFAGGLLGTIIEQVASILTVLAPAISDLLEKMQPLFDAILNDLLPALALLITEGIIPAAAAITTALAPVLTALAGVISTIAQAIAPFAAQLGEAIAGAITALARAIPALGPVLGKFIEAITPLIEALGGALLEVFRAIPPIIRALVPALKGLIPSLINVAKAIGPVAEALSEALVSIIDAIGPVLPEVLDALVESILILAPAIAELVAALAPSFADILREIAPELPTIVDAFTDLTLALIPLIPPLTDVITSLARLFTRILVPAVLDTLTTLVDAFASLPDPLIELLAIVGAGAWVAPKIFGFLSGLAGHIGSLFGSGGLLARAATSLGTFGLRMEEMGGPIGTLGSRLAGLGDLLTGSVSSAFRSAGAVLTTELTGVAAGVGITGAIAAGIGLGVVLHNLIEDHFPAFNRALESVGAAIFDFLFGSGEQGQVGLFGEIGSFFEELGGDLIDAVMKGLRVLLDFLLKFRFAFPHSLDEALQKARDDLKASGFARGGSFGFGQTILVGEEGRELLTFGQSGGHVTSNQKTERILAGDQRPIEVTVVEAHDARATAFEVATEVAREATR